MANWNTTEPRETQGVSWANPVVGAAPETADLKAKIISGALDGSPAYSEVYNSLLSNNDDSMFRDMMYTKEVGDYETARYEALNETLGLNTEDSRSLFEYLATQDGSSFVSDKRTNLEENYAQKVIDTAEAYMQEESSVSTYDVLGDLADSLVKDTKDKLAEATALKEIGKELEEYDKGITFGDVGDVLQQFIPGRSASLQMNELEGFEGSSWLPGQNLRETILSIKALPTVAERVEAVRTLVKNVQESSPDVARKILALYSSGMSEEDAFWDTFQITGFDVLDAVVIGKVAGVGKALKATGKGSATAARIAAGRLNAIRKGASVDPADPAKEIAEESALTSEVAMRTAKDSVDEVIQREKGLEHLTNNLSGLYGVERIANGSTTLNTAAKNRIVAELQVTSEDTLSALRGTASVERLDPEQLKIAVEDARSRFLREAGDFAYHVIDVGPVIRSDFTNTNSISIRLGRKDGSLLSFKGAEKLAKDLKFLTDDVTIKQQGEKFYVEVVKDVDESKSFDDALADIEITTGAVSERSVASALTKVLGKGRVLDPRGARYILSSGNVEQRLKALHGTTNIERIFVEILKPITKLKWSKKEIKELDIILNRALETPNPKTKTKGVNYDTIKELEDAFFDQFNKHPSEKQVRAYYSFRQAMDTLYLMTDAGRLRDIRRVGGVNVELSVKTGAKGKQTVVSGLARPVDNIQPITKTNASIAFIDEAGNVTIRDIGPRTNIADVSERLAKAEVEKHEIVQAIDGPLKIGDDYAHYIVSETPVKKNRVGFGTLGYNYGGLHVAQNPHWVKVPKFVGKAARYYTEDLVHINAFTAKQAESLANALNRARLALKRDLFGNTNDEWKRIVEDELPHLTPEEFKSLYVGKRKVYDIDSPFAATRSGERAAEKINRNQLGENADYIDSTSGQLNPLGDLDRRFAAERMKQDIKTIREESLSQYTISNAPKLSALEALNTGLKQAIPNRLQKDYIFRSINEILNVQRATDEAIFNEDISKIWDAPMDFLHNPQKYLKAGISDANYAKLETIRKAVLRQVEVATPSQKILDNFGDAMLEFAYPGSKTFERLQTTALPLLKDPFLYARKVAFTLSMGLWNIHQIPLQATTYGSMLAISPTYTPHAFAAYTLQRMMLMTTNEGILRHFYKNGYKNFVSEDILKKTGFQLTEDQFVEMFESMRSAGWHRIGNEIGQIDGALNIDFLGGSRVTNAGRIVLDNGLAFFRGVERSLRMTGWNIAYMEFRKANPTKVLTQEDIGRIISRADNLTTNMSSANNANWQRGIFSVPLQFVSYQARMMEQVLPGLINKGPLTRGEAIRLLMMNSALFGTPAGAASAFPFISWSDSVKEYAANNGIDINSGWFEALNEGLVDKFIKEYLGTDLDINSRYGFSSVSFFKDLFGGEKPIWEVLAGPSGRAIASAIGGPIQVMKNLMDYDESFIEVTDFEPLLDLASSTRHWKHSLIAISQDRFVTRTNPNLAEVQSQRDAIGFALSGAYPDYATDTYVMNNVLRDNAEEDKARRKDISNFVKKALTYQDEQWDIGKQYLSKARILAESHGYTKAEFNEIVRNAWTSDSSWERAHKLLNRYYLEKQLKEGTK